MPQSAVCCDPPDMLLEWAEYILQMVNNYVAVYDKSGNCRAASPSAETFFGLASGTYTQTLAPSTIGTRPLLCVGTHRVQYGTKCSPHGMLGSARHNPIRGKTCCTPTGQVVPGLPHTRKDNTDWGPLAYPRRHLHWTSILGGETTAMAIVTTTIIYILHPRMSSTAGRLQLLVYGTG